MAELPPDLDALGDALTRAAARTAAVRRRRVEVRRRLAACVVACMLVFAAMTPSRLSPGEHVKAVQQFASVLALDSGVGCDRPRGLGGSLPQGCEIGHPQPQAAR
jgi:hypothetical protein